MPFGLKHCPVAKSTNFSIIPVVSFSHVHLISSRLQRLCHHNTLDIKENNMALNLNNSCLLFFWSWRWCWLPLHWLSLGFQIIRKYPSFITSSYRIQQIWFILNALQNVQTQLLATFFLFIWQHFWDHFCTNFSHVQFFP